MGPKQSWEPKKQQALENATIRHPRFDKAKLLTNKENQYLQISIPVVNETDITNWVNAFKPYCQYEALLLPRSHEFKGTQMCGSNGLCIVNFDNYPFQLKDEINDRSINSKKYFSNSELWYLAFTILEAAHIFHSKGKKIGDIRPLNVFICDNGQTKIANHLSWPHEQTNYEKTFFDKEITYLAPEEIIDLHFGHTEPKGNFEIAQSFSVGLTLLDSVVLNDSSNLYYLNNNRFDYQKLQHSIQQLFALQPVDEIFKQIVAGLCRSEPAERFKCRDLYQWLSKYKESITNIEPFQITDIPPFLQSGFKPQAGLYQPSQPVKQTPTYFQSQVVAHHSTQNVIYSKPIHYVNPQYPINVIHQPIANNQIIYEVPQQVYQQIRIPDQKVQVRILDKKIQGNSINENEGKVYTKVTSNSPNQNDFRSTLQKIQDQLAQSRKMFPS